MAKIVRRHLINTVRAQHIKTVLLLILLWVAAVFIVFSAFFCYGISLILLFPIFFFIFKLKKSARILDSGADGESSALKILSSLPKDYYIIPDVTLCVGHKTAQVDYIVIGKTGIFIIEAKNHGGTISGNLASRMLIKEKRGEKSEFYNPAFQVATHIRLLSELLSEKKLFPYIHGGVYFSNPNAKLKCEGFHIGVEVFSFDEKAGLISYIRKRKTIFNPKQIKMLKKYIFLNCK